MDNYRVVKALGQGTWGVVHMGTYYENETVSLFSSDNDLFDRDASGFSATPALPAVLHYLNSRTERYRTNGCSQENQIGEARRRRYDASSHARACVSNISNSPCYQRYKARIIPTNAFLCSNPTQILVSVRPLHHPRIYVRM